MGVLKGRNNSGGWSNASVVYGWNSSGVKTYAKALFMRKSDGTWERGWTDCRQHDASGGRDWSSSSSSSTVTCSTCDSCGTSTKVVTTVTYTKTGCTTYTRSSETGCSACGSWGAATTNPFITAGDQYYFYQGTPGYYVTIFDDCRACTTTDPNDPCQAQGYYYITQCSVTSEYRINLLSCGSCTTFYSNQPC